MTLRARLAILLAVMAALVAGLMGALGFIATADRMQRGADEALESLAQRVLAGRGGLTAPGDPEAGGGRGPLLRRLTDPDAPLPPRPFLPEQGAVVATLVAADGGYRVLRTRDDDQIRPQPEDVRLAASTAPRSSARTQDVADVPYRVVAATDGNGDVAVLVGREWSEESLVLRSLAGTMALLAVALAGAAALAGWWMAGRITARLEQLTATAEQVSETGSPDHAVPGTGSDEVGRLAAAFNTMLGRLSSSQAAQRRLVQDAGHELRTPLTSMRTNISLLERLDELPPDVRERVLADLRGESRELSQLVNELLDVATGGIDSGEPQEVALADIVQRVIARARRKTDREVRADCDATVVMGHPAQLERAVWNLVDNAIKFDPDGSPIDVIVRSGELSVADRGPGIAAEERPLVFDRFYRPVASRSLPGSGLGLSIVADVAKSHGAAVSMEPRDGGGSIFRLAFPPDASTS